MILRNAKPMNSNNVKVAVRHNKDGNLVSREFIFSPRMISKYDDNGKLVADQDYEAKLELDKYTNSLLVWYKQYLPKHRVYNSLGVAYFKGWQPAGSFVWRKISQAVKDGLFSV